MFACATINSNTENNIYLDYFVCFINARETKRVRVWTTATSIITFTSSTVLSLLSLVSVAVLHLYNYIVEYLTMDLQIPKLVPCTVYVTPNYAQIAIDWTSSNIITVPRQVKWQPSHQKVPPWRLQRTKKRCTRSNNTDQPYVNSHAREPRSP